MEPKENTIEEQAALMKLVIPQNRPPEVVYTSKYYTVVRAYGTTIDHEGKAREICAEGISRRAWKDINDPKRGTEIATGRALKALKKKLMGERCHHPLMNG
jgi:hypothetical protein